MYVTVYVTMYVTVQVTGDCVHNCVCDSVHNCVCDCIHDCVCDCVCDYVCEYVAACVTVYNELPNHHPHQMSEAVQKQLKEQEEVKKERKSLEGVDQGLMARIRCLFQHFTLLLKLRILPLQIKIQH